MYNGSNDYNAKRLIPSEVVVSRTLQSRYRSYSNVIWRAGKPALDSEWNLINDMTSEWLTSFIQTKIPSGWLEFGRNVHVSTLPPISGPTPPPPPPIVSDNIQFFAKENMQPLVTPNAIVNGWPLLIAGTNFADTTINSIDLPAASSSSRYDFVFLEIWRAQVRSRDTNNVPIAQNKPDVDHIYKFGNKLFGGTNLIDDLVDSAIKPSVNGIETSQRVQVQYKIRVVADVGFATTDSMGFEDTKVQGQGANPNSQITGYAFANMKDELGDPGLWRTGLGDEASIVALGSVDGYSYAIPMFKVFRRSTLVYSDTGMTQGEASLNQQGNSAKIIDLISDRPDGRFNDAIEDSDIVDLRLKTFIGEIEFSEILEKNLDCLLSGELKSSRHPILMYDSISDLDVIGYNDFLHNQGAGGKRTIWSDSSEDQTGIYAEVKTTTTNTSLDAYRATGTGNWNVGDSIKIKVTSKLPVGTIIKVATPKIYVEDKLRSDIGVKGSWSGLGTNEATFVFSDVFGLNNYDIWLYYDLTYPEGQGISFVPDNVLRIDYTNVSSFPVGTVVRGQRLEPVITRFQDLFDHPHNNQDISGITIESNFAKEKKEFDISPLIQTTSTRNGATRVLEVETLDRTAKTIYVPYKLQHLRGVYTSATAGTELATQQQPMQQVAEVLPDSDEIVLNADYYIMQLSSLKYDPTGAFIGTEIEMLISGGGSYGAVLEHRNITGDTVGTRVKLYTTTGVIFDIPSSALVTHFRWSGKKIAVRQSSGAGYDINGFIIDCSDSDNNALFSAMADRQQLWVDMDYLGAPHSGAELRLVYSNTPYQGSDIGGQEIELTYKREKGLFFNNGTGGGIIALSGITGKSNYYYSPVSPKLPGVFQDYLRNGVPIQIASSGQARFDSDLWVNATYDSYGYMGGCRVWSKQKYLMPALPESSQRGFLGAPIFEAIFEEPSIDQLYAEFILLMLVRNVQTGELYLCVQIGNKGIHKFSEGPVMFDLYHLNERVVVK